MYVSALDGLSLNGRIYSYADDTAIIVSSSNWESTWQKSESDIAVLDKWFSNNDLKINFDKSKCIAFTNNTRTEPNKKELNIHKINCNTISCSCPKLTRHTSVKYLGLLIDQNLKWNMHIDNLINKIRQLTYFFLTAKKILNINYLRITYFAMIQSLIQYGIVAWGGCNTTLIHKLSIAQKNIIKIILSKPKSFPSKELFKLLRVLEIENLYKKQAICFIYKTKAFKIKNNHHKLRKQYLEIPFTNTKKASNTFMQVGLRALDVIPDELRKCLNNPNFKYKLKNWFYYNL